MRKALASCFTLVALGACTGSTTTSGSSGSTGGAGPLFVAQSEKFTTSNTQADGGPDFKSMIRVRIASFPQSCTTDLIPDGGQELVLQVQPNASGPIVGSYTVGSCDDSPAACIFGLSGVSFEGSQGSVTIDNADNASINGSYKVRVPGLGELSDRYFAPYCP